MGKIRIRQNYEDYGRVKNAFRDFIHTLVWESLNVDEGVEEAEVNRNIDGYCKAKCNQMIARVNDNVSKFIKSFEPRYEVHLYECEWDGKIIEETAKHFSTDNCAIAFKKAAEFYRYAKRPKVSIFDNEIEKYIAEWN